MKERVYRFRARERRILGARPGARVLDVGCGRGDNLRRLVRYGATVRGVEPSVARAREAAAIAPAVAAVGEALPWQSGSFDFVYVSHVLHHAVDLHAVLAECHRVLAPGGLLFVIETVEDSPLLRVARRIQPRWDGDAVTQRFRFAQLVEAFEVCGLRVVEGETFNWMYFAWELLPLRWRALDFVTPLFVGVERGLGRFFDAYGAHCWLVARKAGEERFPATLWSEAESPRQKPGAL